MYTVTITILYIIYVYHKFIIAVNMCPWSVLNFSLVNASSNTLDIQAIEQPTQPAFSFMSCRLNSLSLAAFAKAPSTKTAVTSLRWDAIHWEKHDVTITMMSQTSVFHESFVPSIIHQICGSNSSTAMLTRPPDAWERLDLHKGSPLQLNCSSDDFVKSKSSKFYQKKTLMIGACREDKGSQ